MSPVDERPATGSAGGGLPADVRTALTRLAGDVRAGRRVLLALDFDGVLAPLQDDPAASRPLPASSDALDRLVRHPAVVLALVSGRSLADLYALAGPPPGSVLVGSHGAEHGTVTAGGLEHTPVDLTSAQRERLARLADRLTAIAAEVPGARVEHKPAAVVLHTRTVPATAAPAAARADRRAVALAEAEGIRPLRGKAVVELAVLRTTKGEAVTALRDRVGADVVLFAGDDVTDEHAFEVLGAEDVTIKVGAGKTAARLRVADPEAFADVLGLLTDLLGD